MKIQGLGVAVITPFTDSYKLDLNALEKVISHLISGGADYLVLLGTTAESVNLDIEEKIAIVETVKSINNHRLPLVVGIGGNNTSKIIEEYDHFDFNGIDAILSVCPYYNKPSQAGIYMHYETLAQASPKPIILYNVSSRTSVNMQAETTLKLAHNCPNIIAIKEASRDFDQAMAIIKSKPDGFSVISGDDILTLPFLSIGMDGVISVTANAYPQYFTGIIKAASTGDYQKARDIHYEIQDMIQLMFSEGSPSGIKALMNHLGFCSSNVRLPLNGISESTLQKVIEAASKLNFQKGDVSSGS